jgi:hypothetical protein
MRCRSGSLPSLVGFIFWAVCQWRRASLVCLQEGAHRSFVAERAELLLRQAKRYGLHTRAQCLEYMGRLFRVALEPPARLTDYQVRATLLAATPADSPSWRGQRGIHAKS